MRKTALMSMAIVLGLFAVAVSAKASTLSPGGAHLPAGMYDLKTGNPPVNFRMFFRTDGVQGITDFWQGNPTYSVEPFLTVGNPSGWLYWFPPASLIAFEPAPPFGEHYSYTEYTRQPDGSWAATGSGVAIHSP